MCISSVQFSGSVLSNSLQKMCIVGSKMSPQCNSNMQKKKKKVALYFLLWTEFSL